MKRPVIGITVDYVDHKPQYMLGWSYAAAVEKAGGLPLMLPYKVDVALVPQYLDLCDGVLLTGGADLDPASYGETYADGTSPIDPDRERFDRAVLAEVERRTLPVLGICLGSQIMNLARGGSLHQFLPGLDRAAKLEHRRLGEDWSARHDVLLQPGSRIAAALGKTTVSANTSHKQSVARLGTGLVVTAHAPDGVVEGTEDPSKPFYVGVQWHPERQHDEADHLKLFEMLVAASRKRG